MYNKIIVVSSSIIYIILPRSCKRTMYTLNTHSHFPSLSVSLPHTHTTSPTLQPPPPFTHHLAPRTNILGFRNVSASYTSRPASAAGSTVLRCTEVRRTGKSISRWTARRWIVSKWKCPVASLGRCWGRHLGTARMGREAPEIRRKLVGDQTLTQEGEGAINNLTVLFSRKISHLKINQLKMFRLDINIYILYILLYYSQWIF